MDPEKAYNEMKMIVLVTIIIVITELMITAMITSTVKLVYT